MNTNLIIGVVVAIAIAGGVWFLLGGQPAEAPSTETTNDSADTSEVTQSSSATLGDTFSGTGSFMELMALGRNLTCDFQHESSETGGTVAGTMKLAGERLRGDFEMMQAGQVYTSHMIQVDDMLYTWSETPQGTFAMKLPVSETEASDDTANPTELRAVDMDSEVTYDCRAWSVDNAVFIPPSNIEFRDMEQMMRGMMQM